MKKFRLPGLPRNSSGWGKVLLTAGLLLVAVVGVFQLYEVQDVFFPGKYHATELNLISKECVNIAKGLKALRTEVAKLNGFCVPAAQFDYGAPSPGATASSSPQSAHGAQYDAAPGWQTTLYMGKKKRVYVVRKLKHLDAMLKSMQRALEPQKSSNDPALASRRLEIEKTLGQIQEIQARCHTYSIELQGLSEKLNQLSGCAEK
jgi:hypothetical protein